MAVVSYHNPRCSKSRATLALLCVKQPAYKHNRLDRLPLTDAEIISAIVRHPVLMQRPSVVAGARAAIGRPPERVLDSL